VPESPSIPAPKHSAQLVRVIGRWSLTALAINGIIGSGIFGLPSTIAGLTGRLSPWAVLLAGLCSAVIVACFAEVASCFDQAGGPYLYARAAFGRFIGIQTGWMLWLTLVAAPAANANLFVVYLAEFIPRVQDPLLRALVLTALVWFMAAVNIAGVGAGTRLSNLFTIAKLLPLFSVIALGIVLHPHVSAAASAAAPMTAWTKSVLLLFFAYGGFEGALLPMSEARNPRRDAPFALMVGLAVPCVVYVLIQWLVVSALPHPASSTRPLADLARLLAGPAGASLVTVGALLSVYGNVSARTLSTPRITLALAEHGDSPRWLAAIHPRFRTPYASILLFSTAVWGFALAGHFAWNVTLSAVARLFYYGVICAAVPVLRKQFPGRAKLRIPGGLALPTLGVLICLGLFTQVDFKQSLILAGTALLAAGNWLWARKANP
jgi:amino acid transporter